MATPTEICAEEGDGATRIARTARRSRLTIFVRRIIEFPLDSEMCQLALV